MSNYRNQFHPIRVVNGLWEISQVAHTLGHYMESQHVLVLRAWEMGVLRY